MAGISKSGRIVDLGCRTEYHSEIGFMVLPQETNLVRPRRRETIDEDNQNCPTNSKENQGKKILQARETKKEEGNKTVNGNRYSRRITDYRFLIRPDRRHRIEPAALQLGLFRRPSQSPMTRRFPIRYS